MESSEKAVNSNLAHVFSNIFISLYDSLDTIETFLRLTEEHRVTAIQLKQLSQELIKSVSKKNSEYTHSFSDLKKKYDAFSQSYGELLALQLTVMKNLLGNVAQLNKQPSVRLEELSHIFHEPEKTLNLLGRLQNFFLNLTQAKLNFAQQTFSCYQFNLISMLKSIKHKKLPPLPKNLEELSEVEIFRKPVDNYYEFRNISFKDLIHLKSFYPQWVQFLKTAGINDQANINKIFLIAALIIAPGKIEILNETGNVLLYYEFIKALQSAQKNSMVEKIYFIIQIQKMNQLFDALDYNQTDLSLHQNICEIARHLQELLYKFTEETVYYSDEEKNYLQQTFNEHVNEFNEIHRLALCAYIFKHRNKNQNVTEALKLHTQKSLTILSEEIDKIIPPKDLTPVSKSIPILVKEINGNRKSKNKKNHKKTKNVLTHENLPKKENAQTDTPPPSDHYNPTFFTSKGNLGCIAKSEINEYSFVSLGDEIRSIIKSLREVEKYFPLVTPKSIQSAQDILTNSQSYKRGVKALAEIYEKFLNCEQQLLELSKYTASESEQIALQELNQKILELTILYDHTYDRHEEDCLELFLKLTMIREETRRNSQVWIKHPGKKSPLAINYCEQHENLKKIQQEKSSFKQKTQELRLRINMSVNKKAEIKPTSAFLST